MGERASKLALHQIIVDGYARRTATKQAYGPTHINGTFKSGKEFLKAAKLLRERSSHLFKPTYFAACQAIELALKGFLRGSGSEVEWMKKKIGHNLCCALVEAEKHGLGKLVSISPEQKVVIKMINGHYASKDLQYALSGFKQMPRIDVLLSVTEQIVDGTRKFCVDNRTFHEGKTTAIN